MLNNHVGVGGLFQQKISLLNDVNETTNQIVGIVGITINDFVNELESFNIKWFPKKWKHVNRYDFLLASVCMLGYPYNLYLLFNMFCINNMNILGCEKSLIHSYVCYLCYVINYLHLHFEKIMSWRVCFVRIGAYTEKYPIILS